MTRCKKCGTSRQRKVMRDGLCPPEKRDVCVRRSATAAARATRRNANKPSRAHVVE